MTVAIEFDHGTVLVRGLPRVERSGLPVRWDPRVQAHRARAFDYSERLSELMGPTVFELSVSDLAGSYLFPLM